MAIKSGQIPQIPQFSPLILLGSALINGAAPNGTVTTLVSPSPGVCKIPVIATFRGVVMNAANSCVVDIGIDGDNTYLDANTIALGVPGAAPNTWFQSFNWTTATTSLEDVYGTKRFQIIINTKSAVAQSFYVDVWGFIV